MNDFFYFCKLVVIGKFPTKMEDGKCYKINYLSIRNIEYKVHSKVWCYFLKFLLHIFGKISILERLCTTIQTNQVLWYNNFISSMAKKY